MDKNWRNGILASIGFGVILSVCVKFLALETSEGGRMFWWFFLIPMYVFWFSLPFVAYAKSKDALAKIEKLTTQKEA